MKKLFVLIPIVMILTGIFIQTSAQDRRCKMKGFGEELNLTADQKTKIDDLRSKHLKAMVDLKANVEKLQIEMHDLVKKGNIDRKAYLDQEEKLMQAQSRIRSAIANHKMDVYALFTPEQKVKVADHPGFLLDGPKKHLRKGRCHQGPGFGPMRHRGDGPCRGMMMENPPEPPPQN
jgi:hypothetical protein